MKKKNFVEKDILYALQNGMQDKAIEFESVENGNGIGFPDVIVKGKTLSFIELKKIDAFPKRATTQIKIPFRPGQLAWTKVFLKLTKGTDVFLMLLIADRFFIFKNENIKESYSFSELETGCVYFNDFKDIDFEKIYIILMQGRR
ncbi:MAG: hypothetical protein PVG39_28215 [Desulfobacteraceae bacterium]|jgi:hypothetical protein